MTQLEKLLVLHEGLVLKKYRCPAGCWTIGVGHNCDANPIPGLPDEITKTKAMEILLGDISTVFDGLSARFPWWKDLDEVRAAVLTDMCFNLGLNGLSNFTNTLKAFKEHRWTDAAEHMKSSKWARQVGTRATRLQQMMITGEWPNLDMIHA